MNSALFPGPASRVTRALIRRWSERLSVSDAAWPALQAELDLWRGKPARFWWRDDDAISQTPELSRLLAIREAKRVPLALAVIPAHATPDLFSVTNCCREVEIFAHGWDHRNHSRPGQPNAELARGRDAAGVASELSDGRKRLEDMAGESFRPVLVPPYNYLAPHLVGSVKSAGFSFVSCSGDFAGLQIASRNVHVDVIDWRRKQVAAPDRMVRGVIAALRLRRYGLVEATSPVGMITHHLVHDEPIWERTRCLLDRLAEHPAVSFPPLGEIFR